MRQTQQSTDLFADDDIFTPTSPPTDDVNLDFDLPQTSHWQAVRQIGKTVLIIFTVLYLSLLGWLMWQTQRTGTNWIQTIIAKNQSRNQSLLPVSAGIKAVYHPSTKTLSTADGDFQLKSVYSEKGEFLSATKNASDTNRIMLIKMKYHNTTHATQRPWAVARKNITASQDNLPLAEGFLNIDAGGSQSDHLANNAVKLIPAGGQITMVMIFAYNSDKGDITIHYGAHSVTHNPLNLVAN